MFFLQLHTKGIGCKNIITKLVPKYLRGIFSPKLVKMIHTTDIVIENITLLNSPRWSCTLSYATNAYINHVNITVPYQQAVINRYGMSNDGIDLDCCVNVTIDDYYYIGGE